jgi:hypothetical protein
LGKGLTTSHHKKLNVTHGLGIGWILWNNLGNGKLMIFGTWNVKRVSIGQVH